ncbi:MAG: type II secretion system protein [Thermotogota bacterium]|nr:type II secretion system protein [Thermotogota bacterium]
MRNNGFSLVELLIVLSVMAALIAAMIPIGMNAIRKAKAVKVARNLKSLAQTAQNIIMINGIDELDTKDNIYNYAKNATSDYEMRIVDTGNGDAYIWSVYKGNDVSATTVCEILPNVIYTEEDLSITSSVEISGNGGTYVVRSNYKLKTSSTANVYVPGNSLCYSLYAVSY